MVPFTSFPPPSSALLLHNAPNTIQDTRYYRLRFSKYSFLPFLSAFSPPFLVSNIKCTLKGVWYQLTYNFCQKTFAFNFSNDTGELSTKILLSNFVIYSAPIFAELFAVFVIFFIWCEYVAIRLIFGDFSIRYSKHDGVLNKHFKWELTLQDISWVNHSLLSGEIRRWSTKTATR